MHLEEPDYIVKQDAIDSIPVIVTKCKAAGLTPEQLEQLVAEPATVSAVMNDKMTVTHVGEDAAGNKIWHFYIETPPMVSNRNMFVTYFIRRKENGQVVIMAASIGNDRFHTSHVDLLQGGEIGELKVSY